MRKALAATFATAALAGAALVGSAGVAAAAHCNDAGMPGSSDFAAHVRAASGPGGHDEGDHKGWASCEDDSANYVPAP